MGSVVSSLTDAIGLTDIEGTREPVLKKHR
jgi:hypothetical protein